MTKVTADDLTADDLYLFAEGTHGQLAAKLGAHVRADGTSFAVWAPNAERVSVIGDFNGWNAESHPLEPVRSSGIWSTHVEGALAGQTYKFHIRSRHAGYRVNKADPFAFRAETPPKTGSIVWDLAYDWGDADWLASRAGRSDLSAPISIYEVHLGSWRRGPDGGWLPYRDVAPQLAEHALDLGFTHVELLPVMEHPFYGSWGYQTTGYFAPTGRFGTPQDLMFLIDHLHQRGLGVILDWVPSHFPADEHGLAYFDGTHLYEHADPRRGYHPDWHTLDLQLRPQRGAELPPLERRPLARHVPRRRAARGRSRLDALPRLFEEGRRMDPQRARRPREPRGRVVPPPAERGRVPGTSRYADLRGGVHRVADGVAPDRRRRAGVRVQVGHGLDARHAWSTCAATRSTVAITTASSPSGRCTRTRRTSSCRSPTTRSSTGRDRSWGRCPATTWQRFANLRLLFGYQWAQTGKKLLFMGDELGQPSEWDHDGSVEWHLGEDPATRWHPPVGA